jgi:hypothetical protein
VGTVRAATWLAPQRHALTHDDPHTVLAALRVLRAEVAAEQGAEAAPAAVITHSLEDLEKRLAQIQYATFAAQGYPRGSGSVESANKLVVEARLKGAGMRWARPHVHPLVVLRTVACSDRWADAWPQITGHLRAQVGKRRRSGLALRAPPARRAACGADLGAPPRRHGTCGRPAAPPRAAIRPRSGPRRPAAAHPWCHSPIAWTRCA